MHPFVEDAAGAGARSAAMSVMSDRGVDAAVAMLAGCTVMRCGVVWGVMAALVAACAGQRWW